MPWHLVDGVQLPDQVAGHVALEFCNTRAGWGSPQPKEYLVSDRALVLWAADTGLRPIEDAAVAWRADGADRSGPASVADRSGLAVDRALALREAVYRCAQRTDDPAPWRLLGEAAARAREHAVLLPGQPGQPATWQVPAEPGGPGERFPDRAADQVLYAVALAAEALLTSPLALTVAACPGIGCGWLFTDPRHRRRWCTMAVCGTRAKARRHAERLRE